MTERHVKTNVGRSHPSKPGRRVKVRRSVAGSPVRPYRMTTVTIPAWIAEVLDERQIMFVEPTLVEDGVLLRFVQEEQPDG